VVKFYNGRGTAEQWIKEGKNALRWARLSCSPCCRRCRALRAARAFRVMAGTPVSCAQKASLSV
jgi:hypothetical protein